MLILAYRTSTKILARMGFAWTVFICLAAAQRRDIPSNTGMIARKRPDASSVVQKAGVTRVLRPPQVMLTVSENESIPAVAVSESCPYWLTLPSDDALCVAASELASVMSFDIVQFHLLRYSDGTASKRVAIVGCSETRRSGQESQSDCIVEELSSNAISVDSSTSPELAGFFSDRGCYMPGGGEFHSSPGSDGARKCVTASFPAAPLTASFSLPPACYQVRCNSEQSLSFKPGNSLQNSIFVKPTKYPLLAEVAKEVGFYEFAREKFRAYSASEKIVTSLIIALLVYLVLKGYAAVRRKYLPATEDAKQPYEVALKSGEGDSVEFGAWQETGDVLVFEKKIGEMRHRLTKIPFAHPKQESVIPSNSPELTATQSSDSTVMFLGRNVDDPKLVFRNPRVEKEQRANIPRFSQAVRHAVAASVLRESPNFKAYIPRALCGSWNRIEGVFQEFVPNAKSITLNDFRESPQMAVDLALLILLLRDTDAHEGNYVRDARRKVAFFDLGCSLADRPLPPYERSCLDNFEVLKRLPGLLDVPIEQRHVEFLNNLDFKKAHEIWRNFQYSPYLSSKVEQLKAKRRRALSSLLPLGVGASPRAIPAFIGGLLSPRNRSNQSTPTVSPAFGEEDCQSSGSSTPQAAPPPPQSVPPPARTRLASFGMTSPRSVRSTPGDFSLDEEQPIEARLVSPVDMVRVMEMHARFLLRCAERGKSLLFAARVFYSGLYDERWLDCGGKMEDISRFEAVLLEIASEGGHDAPVLEIAIKLEEGIPDNDKLSTESLHSEATTRNPKDKQCASLTIPLPDEKSSD